MAEFMDPTRPQVPSLSRFRTVMEDGRVVASHPPMGTTFAPETRYYHNSERNASMHRPDGKKLAFVFGVLATNIVQDIDYLENEIAEAHPTLRHATDNEVDQYNMRIDPRGTVKKSVRTEIESEVREQLEAKIRAELEEKYKLRVDAPLTSTEATNIDGEKLSGTDAVKQRAAKVLKEGIKVEGATVVPVGGTSVSVAALMESRPAPLSGIVGSDTIKAGAAGSGV